MFLEVIFDTFLMNEEEKKLINTDPEDYLRTLEDICERQSVNTPKSAGVRLLEAMSDKVDGTLTIVCRKAIALIEYGAQGLVNNGQVIGLP